MIPDTTNERRQGQNQDLTTKSDELLPLVLDNSVRERFRQQCKLFYDQRQSWWQANDAYEAALKPCSEKVSNLVFEKVRRVARMQQLVKQHLQKSPEYRRLEKTEKRYIEKKAKANEELTEALLKKLREAGVQELPCIFTNELDQAAFDWRRPVAARVKRGQSLFLMSSGSAEKMAQRIPCVPHVLFFSTISVVGACVTVRGLARDGDRLSVLVRVWQCESISARTLQEQDEN